MKFITFKRQSKLIQNRLTTVMSHCKTLTELPELSDSHRQRASSLQEEVVTKQKEYNNIKDKLLNTPASVEDEEEDELLTIDSTVSELLLDIQSTLKALLPNQNDDSLNTTTNTANDIQTNSVRLPKVNLKMFNGDISQWISFHNIFDVSIHQNKALSDVDKFQYLLSCLENEPFNLIKSLPISTANYSIAYETLLKRYHNPRVLKSLHINHLIDMPSCNDANAKNLRSFISQFLEHSSALASLQVKVKEDNPILMTLLLRKFDSNIRTRFEAKRADNDSIPTPDEFIKFLENECSFMENAFLINSQTSRQSVQTASSNYVKPKVGGYKPKNLTLTLQESNPVCGYCNSDHVIYSCSAFSRLTPQERFNFAKSNSLCINCLGLHKTKNCSSKSKCRKCGKGHHTFLHFNATQSNQVSQNVRSKSNAYNANNQSVGAEGVGTAPLTSPPPADIPQCNNVQTTFTTTVDNELFTTILGTLILKLTSLSGQSLIIRALVDCASSCSFVNSDVVNKLQLKRQFSKSVNLVNGISTTSVKTKGITNVNIFTLDNEEVCQQKPVLILDKITADMPASYISPKVRESLKNFKLADPNFDKRGPIQMLLGADLFMEIIKGSKYSLGENMPYALESVFGFIIIGKAPLVDSFKNTMQCNHTTLVCLNQDPLEKLMSNFWLTEQPPETSKLSEDEISCEKFFAETHTRSPETGKFTVRLPFKESPQKLGNSSTVAQKRFFALENKLRSQPQLKQLYCEFMDEYETLGHMSVCHEPPSDNQHYFLPHHGVIKESSSTTRLRVVFDASCKTTNQVSLNDILHVGAKLHNDVASVIINFRKHQYVFTTDVKQMFRSIDLHEDDRKYQLIYWRKDPRDPLQVYQLNTVTYGMSSSPYLANRVVRQLVQEEQSSFPEASQALKNYIYVDDIALGHNDLNCAIQLQKDVINLLNKGGFQLRKWTANNKRLLTDIPEEYIEQPVNFISPEQPLVSVLGIQWIPNTDSFTYQFNVSESKLHTKRNVLSDIARIFDPCGFLAPVVIFAKMFIQILWVRGLDWDSPIPTDLEQKWQSFVAELPVLETLMLPRYFGTSDEVNVELHGFCDASESAYGACVYVRTVSSSNEVKVTLVLAKTKVAPLKRTSLPRLELCAAHLLAKIMNYCVEILSQHVKIDNFYAWSDSTITLAWVSTPSYKLKTFVANRVAQIQEWLPTAAWNHVASSQNPADCCSRGMLPRQLIAHQLWWSGPQWLSLDISMWPKSDRNHINMIRPELPDLKPEKEFSLVSSTNEHNDLLLEYSSWSKLQRIIALLLRFKHNTTKPQDKLTGLISTTELKTAQIAICRMIQRSEFSADIQALNKSKPCSNKLLNLSPFLDQDGLIRVGGRLKNANIDAEAKHPILLPKSHHVTALLVDYYHQKYLHAGPQLLQANIAKQFWILSARSLIRSRIHKCLTCLRFKPQAAYPMMGNLPEARVNPAPCFVTTGLDYGGPFQIKVHTLRRAKVVKAYLCLFVCFVTKAIHIEIALDLSTDSFISALTRFIARRGAPTDIYLDNATNFVGASNQLDRIVMTLLRSERTKNTINNLSHEHSTKFHFIPPSAPHHGGIWESGIKSAKSHLKRVIGETILTLEEFQTLTVRVESILNSRPLCPLSSDPKELDVLTPGHFLIGRPLTALPEPDYENVQLNRLKRWQAVQAMTQRLWKRWQTEYLHTLQQRNKWSKNCPNLEVNDLVLIHDNLTPPQCWKIGRIIATHPGTDGITRVVTLRTPSGELKRPVVKVTPLPK